MVKVTNKEVLGCVEKKEALLNNILHRKANWIWIILRRNCLLHDHIEGQITEVKRVGRTRYWEQGGSRGLKKHKYRLLIWTQEEIYFYNRYKDLLTSITLNNGSSKLN